MKELFDKYLKKLQKLQRDYSDKFIISIDSVMPNCSSCDWYSLSFTVQDENNKIIAREDYLFVFPNYQLIKDKHKNLCKKLKGK